MIVIGYSFERTGSWIQFFYSLAHAMSSALDVPRCSPPESMGMLRGLLTSGSRLIRFGGEDRVSRNGRWSELDSTGCLSSAACFLRRAQNLIAGSRNFEIEIRRLQQCGWISGRVDCGCSMSFWNTRLEATDTSVPDQIMEEFRSRCNDYRIRPSRAQRSLLLSRARKGW